MNTLYLCYLSLFDPLVQTQVVAYLEGLTNTGHRVILLTFEPRQLTRSEIQAWQERLAAKGIQWQWLRYHKRPTLPATAWDILTGIMVGLHLVKQHKVRLLHARAHVPGVIACVIKLLTGAKFLFDIRGFMAEEYVDGGVWRAKGFLFRLSKWVERFLINGADGIVVLTKRAKEFLNQRYPHEIKGKPVQIIPCCFDFRSAKSETQIKRQKERSKTLAYIGKLGGWYSTEEILKFFVVAKRINPKLRLRIWTQSNPAFLKSLLPLHGLDGEVSLGTTPPDNLHSELDKATFGIAFYRRKLSAVGCSPTKIGEYLAAGLPVVVNSGIGDVDELLLNRTNPGGRPVGVVINEFSEQAYVTASREILKLLSEPDIRKRCRAVAHEHLDLEQIGWFRYGELYAKLS